MRTPKATVQTGLGGVGARRAGIVSAKAMALLDRIRSREDRRLFATRRYKIETVIAKNDHLFSTATITFAPWLAGERILKFGLLPNLRVTRVTDDQGQDLYFIQETARSTPYSPRRSKPAKNIR